MKFYHTLSLCGLCLYAAVSCNKDHDFVLQAKLAEMNLTRNNFMLDRESRQNKLDTMGMELSTLYPAAPPFGRDTTRRIFRYPVPAKMNGIPLWKIDTSYVPANDGTEMLKVWRNANYQGKPYFIGHVAYVYEQKNNKNSRGILVTVSDMGHIPQWAIQMNNDLLDKGENPTLFSEIRKSFVLERKVDYKGHTWQVWVPNDYTKAMFRLSAQGDVAAFTSFWNRRFVVTMFDIDTASSKLETFYKLVDVEWLEKLKSPIH